MKMISRCRFNLLTSPLTSVSTVAAKTATQLEETVTNSSQHEKIRAYQHMAEAFLISAHKKITETYFV